MRIELDRSKKNYIFGAGNYARNLYCQIYLSGQASLVSGFVVSDADSNPESVYGMPVYALVSVGDGLRDAVVYLAVSQKKADGIAELLEDYAVGRVVQIEKEDISNIGKRVYQLCEKKPINHKKVFFDCFNGSGYACNCKYTAKKLLELKPDLEYVWDVRASEEWEMPPEVRVVERFSPQCYEEYYTSGIIVSNMNTVFGFQTRKGQYVINTWHGTGPFKKLGVEVSCYLEDEVFKKTIKRELSMVDLAIAASRQCIHNFRKSFMYDGEIGTWGYPRNDVFFHMEGICEKVRQRLGIPKETRIALYAPTFRYNASDYLSTVRLSDIYDLDLNKVKGALEKRFREEFLILYRFHHRTYRSHETGDLFHDGMDVTMYPDMQELLVAADVLITDWSSSIWDFSLTEKPVFQYYHDVNDAAGMNGFYLSPDEYPYPKGHTTDELCNVIDEFEEKSYREGVKQFIDRYGAFDDGHASERLAERIIDVANHPDRYGKA